MQETKLSSGSFQEGRNCREKFMAFTPSFKQTVRTEVGAGQRKSPRISENASLKDGELSIIKGGGDAGEGFAAPTVLAWFQLKEENEEEKNQLNIKGKLWTGKPFTSGDVISGTL